jgi:hypothetical protein
VSADRYLKRDRRAQWERYMLAALASGKPAKAAAEVADGALAAFRQRFDAEIATEIAEMRHEQEPSRL